MSVIAPSDAIRRQESAKKVFHSRAPRPFSPLEHPRPTTKSWRLLASPWRLLAIDRRRVSRSHEVRQGAGAVLGIAERRSRVAEEVQDRDEQIVVRQAVVLHPASRAEAAAVA